MIEFALSVRPVELLLERDAIPDRDRYHLIQSVQEAEAFRFSDVDTDSNYEELGGSHWSSILADEIAPMYAVLQATEVPDKQPDEIIRLFDGRWNDLSSLLAHIDLGPIVSVDHGDLCDVAVSNLYYVAAWRATIGEDSPFIADMWNAFQTGGWPFGWYGEYPDGKMVVWKPEV